MQASFTSVAVAPHCGLRVVETRYAPYHVLPPHDHEYASLSLIFAGGQEERVGRARHDCSMTNAVFKTAEVGHSDHVGSRGMHGLFVELTHETHARLKDAGIGPQSVATFASRTVNQLTRRIACELAQRESGYELALEGLLFEFLASMVRTDARARNTKAPPPWLRHARDYVEAHFRDGVSLADVATAVRMHPSHVASEYRRVFGSSVGEHVRTLRVEHARRLIMGSARTLTDIAAEAGFADQSHLTRLFRLQYGMTPARLRGLPLPATPPE